MPRLTIRYVRLISLIVILFVLVVGISTYVAFGDEEVIPEQTETNEVSIDNVYKLRSGDLVSIGVYGQSDLATEQRIDGSGYVQIPLLGAVAIGDLSVRECETKLETEFVENRFLRDPQVSVHVKEYALKSISVFGEVNRPGRIDYENETFRMDLIEVIALAGDFTGIAKKSEVIVTRIGKDGVEEKHRINVQKKLVSGNDEDSVFWVYSGDVVYVPESLF